MQYQGPRPPVQPTGQAQQPQGQLPQQQPYYPPMGQGFYAPGPVMPPAPPKKSGAKAKILMLLAVIAAAALGFFGVKSIQNAEENNAYQALLSEVTAADNVFLQNVYVDDIHLGGMTAQQGLDAVYANQQAKQNSWNLHLTYQGQLLGMLNYETLGIRTSQEEAYGLVKQAFELGKLGTLEERKQAMDAVLQNGYRQYTTQSSMNEEWLDSFLLQLQQQFTYAPTDAYLAYFRPDLEDPFIIQPGYNGSSLDVDVLKSKILHSLQSGQSSVIEVQPTVIIPNVTEADVRNQVSLMHRAVTPVSEKSTEDRTNNIRVAFGKVNGLIMEPGASFSFNGKVGARTLENGFKYAIEYVNGEEEMGIGGGVCQASTTIYLAALQSGLEITKREPHADPVSYTTFGQDATVYYSRDRKIDMAFKNTSGGTIYLVARVEQVKKNQYQCVVSIYGPTLGEDVHYSLRTETVETIMAPLSADYREDKNQTYVKYRDQEKLVQKAREGYINETYLQRWEKGEMVEETLVSRDTCKARPAIYYVGTQYR